MVSSGCAVLLDEPERFMHYVFADARVRKGIVDDKSFAQALEKALLSDGSLSNIVQEIKGKGESIEICGKFIYQMKDIQDLIESNLKQKTKLFRKRIKAKYPSWKRGKIKKELDRRIKILIGTQAGKIKQTKQITIQQATIPVKVTGYVRAGKKIASYRKSAYRHLNEQEEMLIISNIKRGKKPREIITRYYDAGLDFRSESSIRRHIERMRQKLGK